MDSFINYFAVLIILISLQQIDSLSENSEYVANLVAEINSMETDWEAGYNELAELDTSELKRLMGVKIKPDKVLTSDFLEYDIEVPANIPRSFDSRHKWPKCHSINSIKDQSNCGSCWAMSAASAMSDRLCISSNAAIRVNLSTEALMTCCKECTGGGLACDGGYLQETWKYLKWHGLVTGGDYGSKEGCQPYKIKPCNSCPGQAATPACVKDKCTNKLYKRKYKNDIHKNRNYYGIPSNEKLIQADILKNGPLIAGFQVFRDFMSYKRGVYSYKTGVLLGSHAVRVIGWGVQKKGRKSTKYWLAANSWNRSWGDNGFFKIQRGNDECEFESNVFAGVPH